MTSVSTDIKNVTYVAFKRVRNKSGPITYAQLNPIGYNAVCKVNNIIFVTTILGADIADFDTNLKPTAIQSTTLDDAVADAIYYTNDTTTYSIQAYDIQSTVMYVGTAIQGTLNSDAKWLIKKVALDGGGNPTSTKWSSTTAVWNNRTSETYT
jgi:hypothetical protein